MRLSVSYDRRMRSVVIAGEEEHTVWVRFCRYINDISSESIIDRLIVKMPWRAFLVHRGDIYRFIKTNDCQFVPTQDVMDMLANANPLTFSFAIKHYEVMPKDEVISKLEVAGFRRTLTTNQISNVSKIVNLSGAATFSVPGAGKTTEALAYYAINSIDDERLLVVAPKNAFGAWDEQLFECFGIDDKNGFVRLRGGNANITKLLSKHPRFMIMTYSQMPYVQELIMKEMEHGDFYMFLDESHRIKSGRGGAWCDSVLDVSTLPSHKLVMSGTPMPQNTKDLIPQFEFLYPDKYVDEETVVDTIQSIFVRTTQAELRIPPIERKLIRLEMNTAQASVYGMLRDEAKRELVGIPKSSKMALKSIGHCYIRLLQFVSNPALLSSSLRYAFDQHIGKLLLDGNGPKIDYACWRARQLAATGEKVIIWSSFVQNVELISALLSDIGADYIHGGVEAGSDEEEDTREGKIKRFHNDPSKMVLVANPAACSEGISLHKVCHYAIYIDRSFNAAQYLQSEDRIHRLGLEPNQIPVVEIIECNGTIDEVVNIRLEQKVNTMAAVLNDKSLEISADFYDPGYEPGEEISTDDAMAVLQYFGLGGNI